MIHRHCTKLILAALSALASIPAGAQPGRSPVTEARQVVLVVTDGWNATGGALQRFERSARDGRWSSVGARIPVTVGRTGLAWGVGLHDADVAGLDGPRKREGDGRAPAGAFRLSGAFGYRPASEVPWVRLPYVHSTPGWKCVDDSASRYYNQVVNERSVSKDWTSKEDMLRDDHLYRLGVVVDHNWAGQTRPGGGSCIFLHIWRGPGEPTVGCTAMAEPALEQVVRWLDPDRSPVLVQLPRPEYRRLRRAWRLPQAMDGS